MHTVKLHAIELVHACAQLVDVLLAVASHHNRAPFFMEFMEERANIANASLIESVERLV